IGQETDVAFITFVNNDLRSNTIEELNFGGIFPYLHFYNEKDMIQTFEMDQHPDSKGALEISKTDDYDLGSSAWLSLDEGASGKAHGIIFESNKVIKYGPDEYEGIELQLWEIKSPQLPGLEGNTAVLYIMKNAYEEGGRDDELPENYVVEFNAEFFTTESGGYTTVAEEAEMYQSLIGYQPTNDNNITNDDEEVEKYNLTAYAHFASSFPFGSLLSTGYGYNVSYLTAEIYKENYYTSTGPVCSVSLCKSIPADFVDLSLIEKLKAIREILDWKNLTIFKKICFSGLEK
ncbi:MAG: carboxypeptidase regulatory-like domain-containing protein, partial [Thermoplasmatales archaeon]|nr:carboxypeptidase regulatory-like domain-containing protein [Thermoplasmatales archaeon]